MGWKFWQQDKSAAEVSLEQLRVDGARAAVPSPPAGPGRAQSDPSFRMPIEDVFSITGRGTVVTGRIETGGVAVGQQITMTTADGATREVSVTGVEMFRKIVDRAAAGDNVGLLLGGVSHADVQRGDVLTG